MTVADGARFDHAIEIEILNQNTGSWEMVAEYDCNDDDEGNIYFHGELLD